MDRRCKLTGQCTGCPWLDKSLDQQRQLKLLQMANLLETENVNWISCGDQALRDRADLTWENGRLGLYDHSRNIIDIEECLMLSGELEKWLIEYRSVKPPIYKGSVRLRVAPDKTRGVWLDFSNLDVKTLFEQVEYLKWLSERAIVEIGQRKKRLVWKNDLPKLSDPVLFPWFETYSKNQTLPVYGTIAGFTQAGLHSNRHLVSTVMKHIEETGKQEWLELFCGSGNFTLAMLGQGLEVQAVENDELALQALALSCEGRFAPKILKVDLTRFFIESSPANWLVDPPRFGLKHLLNQIQNSTPENLVYVSCWPESLKSDLDALKTIGYRIRKVSAVDQFVHSPNTEWVITLTKNTQS